MKTLQLSIFVITGIVLIGINFSNVYAPCLQGVVSCGPPPGVTVAIGTDNGAYEKNETINVKGWIYLENYQKPVLIQVINPANATIQNYHVPIENGTFNLKINANFETTGLYRIVTCINSWCDGSYFKFVAEPYKLSIENKDFLINYKTTADLEKISADVAAKSIRLHVVNATADAHKIAIELPRSIIDSKSQNNSDMNFSVLVGENQPDKFMENANFKEIATTSYSRTLQIDIPYDPIPDVQGIWDFKITGTTFLGTSITILSPLKQFKSGISPLNVKCSTNYVPVIKAKDGSPACVTPQTATRLIQSGWAKNHTGVDALGYPPVQLFNVTTSPQPIILGMPFYVNAIVVNHQTYPITYYTGCVYPISVSLDNIKTSTSSIHCLAISKNVLGPNEQAVIHSDRIETSYNVTVQNTIATIKFIYEVNGNQTSFFTSKQFPIQREQAPTEKITGLANDTGIVTLENKTYYFETPVVTENIDSQVQTLFFHNVVFTLYPQPHTADLIDGCQREYYWTDAKFSDGTRELLHIFVDSQQCTAKSPTVYFSTHTDPQAGLTFYDGKMKLLVDTEKTQPEIITTDYTNSTIGKFTVRNIGGAIQIEPDNLFNQTVYFSGNVGQLKAGFPVNVSISDPYDMFIKKYTISSSEIAQDGSFNFTHTFLGKYDQDVYTLDFSYGSQRYELKYNPVVPP